MNDRATCKMTGETANKTASKTINKAANGATDRAIGRVTDKLASGAMGRIANILLVELLMEPFIKLGLLKFKWT